MVLDYATRVQKEVINMGIGCEIINIHPYEDSRGTLKKVLMESQLNSGSIEEVYLLYTSKGSVRGNHYHKKTLEYFAIVSGKASIVLKDLSSDNIQLLKISAEDNKIIKIPPEVIHAFKNEHDEPLIILAISTKEYNKLDTDTYETKIV